MNILSDRFRWPAVIILVLFLAVIFVLNYFQVQREMCDLVTVLDQPAEHAGRPLAFFYAKVIDRDDTTCTIRFHGLTVPIRPPAPFPDIGNVVSFYGVLRADGTVTVADYHLHRGRYLKLYVSQVPMVVIFVLILMQYRFNFQRLWFEERDAAHA